MSASKWLKYDPILDRAAQPSFATWTDRDMGLYASQLQSDQTKRVYVSPDGQRIYNLAGGFKGNRGVVQAPGMKGATGVAFDQLYSSGPWMLGEEPERTDYRKRVLNLALHFAPHINAVSKLRYPDTGIALEQIQAQWWRDWPEDVDLPMGFMGEFTRYDGWHWIRVRNGEPNFDTVEIDPRAYGNYYATASMTIHCPFPFYSKRALTREWRNDAANAVINGRNHGILRLPNKGDYEQWPKFIVEGAGKVSIQDGLTDRMVDIEIFPSDGMVLVDTDPSARTLTSEHDPIDNALWKLIRNSDILDFILGDITNARAGVPIGRRVPGGVGFMSPIPSETMANIKVTHTNPAGMITMVMSQWYRRGVA